MNTPRIAVVGATGYAGAELVRLLLNHPEFELAAVASRSQAGHRLDSVHPGLRGLSPGVRISTGIPPDSEII